MERLTQIARRVTNARAFELGIVVIIVLNGAMLGLGTSQSVASGYGAWLHLGYQVSLAVFIAEALLKMAASAPRGTGYFRDGWNVFDFLVIVLALIPATGDFALVVRLARLLRVMRLLSAIRELRLIVTALVHSIPSVGHVIMLMSIIVYIYAIVGYELFSDHDPAHWGSLGMALLTLFNIITLEGWTEVMFKAMEFHPLAWLYFVSFVVVGTFVVINLFIAIIINNLDEAKLERIRDLETPVSREELLRELRATQDALRKIEQRLKDY